MSHLVGAYYVPVIERFRYSDSAAIGNAHGTIPEIGATAQPRPQSPQPPPLPPQRTVTNTPQSAHRV